MRKRKREISRDTALLMSKILKARFYENHIQSCHSIISAITKLKNLSQHYQGFHCEVQNELLYLAGMKVYSISCSPGSKTVRLAAKSNKHDINMDCFEQLTHQRHKLLTHCESLALMHSWGNPLYRSYFTK